MNVGGCGCYFGGFDGVVVNDLYVGEIGFDELFD